MITLAFSYISNLCDVLTFHSSALWVRLQVGSAVNVSFCTSTAAIPPQLRQLHPNTPAATLDSGLSVCTQPLEGALL